MSWVNVNGKLEPASGPVLMASNRSYRYGDGLFETMCLNDSVITLFDLHMDRLFSGIRLLQMETPAHFTAERLLEACLSLCRKNQCGPLARIRLSVFRGDGGLYDENRRLGYLIECWPLSPTARQWNENGLLIDIFPDARKSCDVFSPLKSASFLSYALAAQYAKANRINDALVLNTADRIADASIANLFILRDGTWITPPLSEGPVAGVMRRWLLEQLPAAGHAVRESPLSEADLLAAEEVILTNAVYGLRWVKGFRNARYAGVRSESLHRWWQQTIAAP